LPFAWVVIYAMNQGVSAADAGVLTAIEMAAAMVCYLPASALADRYGKEPFVIATFVMFTLFPVFLAGAHTFPMLALAFVIKGLKEFGEPARKSLIVAYAPEHARAATVGAYYLIRDTVVTTGSFAGATLWQRSPEWAVRRRSHRRPRHRLRAACYAGRMDDRFVVCPPRGGLARGRLSSDPRSTSSASAGSPSQSRLYSASTAAACRINSPDRSSSCARDGLDVLVGLQVNALARFCVFWMMRPSGRDRRYRIDRGCRCQSSGKSIPSPPV
jgi:hypothetical protein